MLLPIIFTRGPSHHLGEAVAPLSVSNSFIKPLSGPCIEVLWLLAVMLNLKLPIPGGIHVRWSRGVLWFYPATGGRCTLRGQSACSLSECLCATAVNQGAADLCLSTNPCSTCHWREERPRSSQGTTSLHPTRLLIPGVAPRINRNTPTRRRTPRRVPRLPKVACRACTLPRVRGVRCSRGNLLRRRIEGIKDGVEEIIGRDNPSVV